MINGEEATIAKSLFNLSDLQTTLLKYTAFIDIDNNSHDEIVDRLAEVVIACEQMALIFGNEDVNEAISMKLSVLNQIINN